MQLPMFALAAAVAFGQASSNVTVSGARLDESKGAIEVEVVYGGGCKEHTFALEIQPCRETSPVSCDVKVVDTTKEEDNCRALIHKTVVFPLEENGLNSVYFKNATLVLKGANESSATVQLTSQPSTTVDLPEGSANLRPLEGVLRDVTVAAPKCPKWAACEITSEAQIDFELGGCVDSLGPVTYSIVRTDGKIHIFLSAINIHNEMSNRAACFAMPKASVKIPLGLGIVDKNSVVLHNLRGIYR